jgi:hypothetical protein
MTRYGDLDFRNAIKGDLDRNMSDSAFVYSFSRQHCFLFQFLEPSRAICQHGEEGVAI